jgi:tetratricopeptide (TPR) repeat protein
LKPRTIFAVYALVGAVLFVNALGNPFVYDDFHSIQYNPHIRTLQQIERFVLDPHTFSSQPSGYMFRPLTSVTLALNYAAHGQEVWGYRAANLVLHILCSFALFLLIRKMGSLTLATATGVIFLVHPLHSEPVNYISSRSDLLVSFLYLSATTLLVGTRVRSTIFGHIIFAAGLLAKSVAITVPLMTFALESSRFGVKRTARSIVASWSKYWTLTLVALLYVFVIWSNRYVQSSIDKMPRSIDVQLLTQAKAWVYYLWMTIVPLKLNIEHQFLASGRQPQFVVLLSVLFLGSWIISIIRLKERCLGFGAGWFVITLLPASIVPLNILVSERRAYLASAGLILISAWAWHQYFRVKPIPAAAIGVIICVMFSVLTIQRNDVWGDEVSIWEDSVGKSPLMPRSRLNLAMAYHKKGKSGAALSELEMGLKLQPDFAQGWVLKGNILSEKGKIEEAEAAYRTAIEHNSQLPGVYHNIGNLSMAKGQAAEAGALFETALRVDPHFVKARNNLGQAYEAQGNQDAAFTAYKLAVADSLYWPKPQDPEFGGAWLNLARILEQRGEFNRAQNAFYRAADLLGGEAGYEEYAAQARTGARRTAKQ